MFYTHHGNASEHRPISRYNNSLMAYSNLKSTWSNKIQFVQKTNRKEIDKLDAEASSRFVVFLQILCRKRKQEEAAAV